MRLDKLIPICLRSKDNTSTIEDPVSPAIQKIVVVGAALFSLLGCIGAILCLRGAVGASWVHKGMGVGCLLASLGFGYGAVRAGCRIGQEEPELRQPVFSAGPTFGPRYND